MKVWVGGDSRFRLEIRREGGPDPLPSGHLEPPPGFGNGGVSFSFISDGANQGLSGRSLREQNG